MPSTVCGETVMRTYCVLDTVPVWWERQTLNKSVILQVTGDFKNGQYFGEDLK